MLTKTTEATLPVLYSFRRCPYAIRARLAIKISRVQVELREVILADKPKEMLSCSPKGTVPVLYLPNTTVLDESRDIMLWALKQHDPDNWLSDKIHIQQQVNQIIEMNDTAFKHKLDQYKYADRVNQKAQINFRQDAEFFLQYIEEKLSHHQYLVGNDVSFADIAILPFIRQFAYVDKDWFDQSSYINCQRWLGSLLSGRLFNNVMKKFPQWKPGEQVSIF